MTPAKDSVAEGIDQTEKSLNVHSACVGDIVFFNHPQGPMSGKVTAAGKHGATIQAGKTAHRIYWRHVVGIKKRVTQNYNIVETGEDGHIVEDANGGRRFVMVPNEAREDPMVAKALPPGEKVAGRPGLTQKEITDKTGRHQKKWVRANPDQPKERDGAAPPEAGAKHGFGTQRFNPGDRISFKAGDFAGEGTIVGQPGRDGAHVKDASGRTHRVKWAEVTGKGGAQKKSQLPEKKSDSAVKPIHPDHESFSAGDYAKQYDDPNVTEADIMAQFSPDVAKAIGEAQQRLQSIEETINLQKQDGKYTVERQAKHREIWQAFLSDDRVKAAMPSEGQAPTLTLLGGRGGSGKSSFGKEGHAAQVYSEKTAIVIDPDKIKGLLPEYAGWNAAQVHEESSEIATWLVFAARKMGLNIVLDKTMASSKKILNEIKEFKGDGYEVDAHYMHLPRQEAAKRAVQRFTGKEHRFVPPHVVLANTDNEKNFDEVKKHARKWSMWDNNVPMGQEPKLVSRNFDDEPNLRKSQNDSKILIWKRH